MLSRRGAMVFIHIYAAVQLLAPLTYYLLRADRFDERYAWRMFSPTRMVECGAARGAPPQFLLDGQPAALDREFHEAWIALARRGRHNVIDAMSSALCRRHAGASLRVVYECRALDGAVVAESRAERDVCRSVL